METSREIEIALNEVTQQFHIQIQKQKQIEEKQTQIKEEYDGKLQELQAELAVCNEQRQELEKKVAGFRHDDDDGVNIQIYDLAIADDKDRMINLVLGRWLNGIQVPEDLLFKVIDLGAVNSAEALPSGDGGLKLDPNVPLSHGTFVLHHAASMYSITLIELLICHGARTDVVTDGDKLINNGMLPLNVALEHLRFHDYLVDWTSKDSIFKLITILYLPQMKVPLEATGLLAQHTKETKEEFYLYAKDGYPVQMVVLLMVARDIVLSPFPSQSDDGSNLDGIMSIRKCIEKEIASLVIAKGCKSNSKHVWKLKDRKAGLHFALLLLDAFERAGDAIDNYLKTKPNDMLSKDKVVEDMKSILQKAGFKLKKKDTDLNNILWETYDGWRSNSDLSSKDFTRITAIDFQPQSPHGNVPEKIDIREQNWAVKRFFPDWTPTLADKIDGYLPYPIIKMSSTWFENPKRMFAKVKNKATSRDIKASTPLLPKRHYTTRCLPKPQITPSQTCATFTSLLMKAAKRL